jgi:hypothetical protein
MRQPKILVSLCIALLLSFVPVRRSLAQTVYFDDSGPDSILVGNSFYEIEFDKSNGAIASITDKATGRHVSEGSRYGCLWGAFGSAAGYVGGCSFHAKGADRFSYAWSATTNTLSLTYTSASPRTHGVAALITLTASEHSVFDLRLQLQSHWGSTLEYVSFPSDLVFREPTIQAAYLPVLPGIVLTPTFFDQNRSYIATYPGDLFADFAALSSSGGNLAISSSQPEHISPLYLGFNHDDDYINDSTYYYHTFGAWLSDGETWVSPTVRVRVSQSPREAINGYRTDTQIDRFESLAAKLGTRYPQVVQSPLYKADATHLSIPFSEYPELLAAVPAPGIIHTLAFQERGFDENYPDLLPPAPAWGTVDDMAAMVRKVQAMDFLVMPYTNPTWWDDASPTLQHLPAPLGIPDIALLDATGMPRFEQYSSHDGYVVSPYAPFVRQRLDELMSSMTTTIPSDIVFEDQVGSRPWLFDSNVSSPSPTAYSQGWLDHTRAYSKTLLMTEAGFDRLAETNVGFHGSVLLPQRLGQTGERWGDGTWYPYPIAPMMMRDKVLLYQHDLAPETFTTNKATLAWNLAFGYQLSYDLGSTNFGGGVDDPWLHVVSDFQRSVISRYASDLMTGYTLLQGAVTQSSFAHAVVVANWSDSEAYVTASYILPPRGALVALNDGSVIAGVFTSYNGVPLSGGEHFLIEERYPNEIVVRQPLGAGTSLTVGMAPGWKTSDPIVAWAVSRTGNVLGSALASVTASGITFAYQSEVTNVPVAYYRITQGHQYLLPVIHRTYPVAGEQAQKG